MQLGEIVVNSFPDGDSRRVFEEFKAKEDNKPGTKKDSKVDPDSNPNSRKLPTFIIRDEKVSDIDNIGEFFDKLSKSVGAGGSNKGELKP